MHIKSISLFGIQETIEKEVKHQLIIDKTDYQVGFPYTQVKNVNQLTMTGAYFFSLIGYSTSVFTTLWGTINSSTTKRIKQIASLV